MNRRVTHVQRSPLNARCWFVEFECGHDEWVSVVPPTRRPKAGDLRSCERCRAARVKKDGLTESDKE